MIEVAPVDPQSYNDGYIRTFMQDEIPEFTLEEKEMLYYWLDNNQMGEIVIYLTMDKYTSLDAEMAEFTIRELYRRNI